MGGDATSHTHTVRTRTSGLIPYMKSSTINITQNSVIPSLKVKSACDFILLCALVGTAIIKHNTMF